MAAAREVRSLAPFLRGEGWGEGLLPQGTVTMGLAETPHSPSLRAQRSNPESFRGDSLDCFAALAMTMWMQSDLSPQAG
ncbi:hypothetical protein ACVWXO_003752 [Bradyrhizobium sp. LM2.7]